MFEGLPSSEIECRLLSLPDEMALTSICVAIDSVAKRAISHLRLFFGSIYS
jgi:hypothetical protein